MAETSHEDPSATPTPAPLPLTPKHSSRAPGANGHIDQEPYCSSGSTHDRPKSGVTTTRSPSAGFVHRSGSNANSAASQPPPGFAMNNAISPPTPAPSPRPGSRSMASSDSPLLNGRATPNGGPGSDTWASSVGHASAYHAHPPTPVSPLERRVGSDSEDYVGEAMHDGVTAHQVKILDPSGFVDHFIESVVTYFPRLSLPQRRKLFSSLLPHMHGEDLLHLSCLISPFLKRDFLGELPTEISLNILSFLDDPKDLVRAARVSKTWRNLVSDESNWKWMLLKYRGRGWMNGKASESSYRPPIEKIRQQHPEASFREVTSPVTSHHPTLPPQPHPQQRLPTSMQGVGNTTDGAALQSRGASLRNRNRDGQPNRLDLPRHHQSHHAENRRPEERNAHYHIDGYAAAESGSLSADSRRNRSSRVESTVTLTAPQGGVRDPQSRSHEALGKGKGREVSERLPESFNEGSSSGASSYSYATDQAPPSVGPPDYGLIGIAASSAAGAQSNSTPSASLYWQLRGLGFSRRNSGLRSQNRLDSSGASRLPPPAPQDLLIQQSMQSLSLHSSRRSLPLDSSMDISPSGSEDTSVPQAYSAALPHTSAPAQDGKTDTYTMLNGRTAPEQAEQLQSKPALSTSPSADWPSSFTARAHMYGHGSPSDTHAVQADAQTVPLPRKRRYVSHKSINPFGTAITSSLAPPLPHDTGPPPLPRSFSYKAQFKKAYLTESNWLRGPGRLLSRQTSTEDKVVTSLGFDKEWIVVGMANNQVHVFDARTGAYYRELIGHNLGVWCLVLVSKGGDLLDKEGRRVKVDKQTTAAMSWQHQDSDSDESNGQSVSYDGSGDESDEGQPGLPRRSRSASARPPSKERFFQEAAGPLGTGVDADSIHGASRAASGSSATASSDSPSHSSGEHRAQEGTHSPQYTRTRRPSSFCGASSSSADNRERTASGGFPFSDHGNISAQQASACGTAGGWGQPGAIAVTGGCDREVRVWDVNKGVCLHILRGHHSTVRCLKVLDGRPIAVSGSRDATLRVWDIERGVQLRLLSGHQHSVRCIEISGNKAVSGSYDTTCRVWDIDTGECLHVLQGHQHQIYAVAFDGQRVASGSLDSTVRIWSAKTGECLALLQGHTSLVGQLQLTDSVLVTGGSDGRVIIFSLSTFECLHRLCAHDNSVTCLQFNDRFMVTGGNDGKVKLWDRPSGKLIRELSEPCEAVWRVTFREDKCVLLCKRNGRTVMDVRTFAPHEDEL